MGLTLIRKSKGAPKQGAKVALVLAGGAVSGGAFKVGGLKALNDYMTGRGMTDLDIYVGLSAGAILAIPLAAGLSPDSMVGVLDGTSEEFDQLRPTNFYSPNWREFVSRPTRLVYNLASYLPGVTVDWIRGIPSMPDALGSAARQFINAPTYAHFEALAIRAIEHIAAPQVSVAHGSDPERPLRQRFARSLDAQEPGADRPAQRLPRVPAQAGRVAVPERV